MLTFSSPGRWALLDFFYSKKQIESALFSPLPKNSIRKALLCIYYTSEMAYSWPLVCLFVGLFLLDCFCYHQIRSLWNHRMVSVGKDL